MPRKPAAKPTWNSVQAKLNSFDRAKLIDLLGDLYSASEDNQTFLHTRFTLGTDPLKPYKDTISRWVYPDVFERQTYSVAKAKGAVSAYRKAITDAGGLAELMVFFCEQASTFCSDLNVEDEGFLDALVSMFSHALKGLVPLDAPSRVSFLARLRKVRDRCQQLGYGIGDEADQLWSDCSLTKAEA